jgi:hypothetical protein
MRRKGARHASLTSRATYSRPGKFSASFFCVVTLTDSFMNEIPIAGTIRRCSHSVYWPENHRIAFACGFCNPNGTSLEESRKFVMPENGQALADSSERIFANGGDATGHCPKCRSRIHFVSEKSRRLWICAECAHEFSAPKVRR